MRFLLDTNLISEWVKPVPHPEVVRWLDDADEDALYLSVVTLTEIRFGIDRLPMGARRGRLDEWLRNDLLSRFEQRILPVDAPVAMLCGALMANSSRSGRPMATMDALLAATALEHALVLVTLNVNDFQGVGLSVANPWSPER